MSILNAIFGDDSSRFLKENEPLVNKINALEVEFQALGDDGLRGKTLEFKERLNKGESMDDILPEAFALVREASRRTLGLRQFDVQLLGGVAIHKGNIAEMRTGEGKTLVATLPTYLNALAGKGVHIITVNDYLAQRDAVWMGQVYEALGMSVGVISHESSFIYNSKQLKAESLENDTPSSKLQAPSLDSERDEKGSFKVVHEFLKPCSRMEAYEADITYGSNSEFGFDYLRDNLEYEPEKIRQKTHFFAVVDEIDSILIDEARTPLIISAPSADSDVLYKKFAEIATKMQPETDYMVDEKLHSVLLTDEGISNAEKFLGLQNLYAEGGVKLVHHLETALKAKALYHKDKEYVLKGNEVVIVDQFTGRLQPGRRWSDGLHQAIEAKEGANIQKESKTYASITYQNYFRMYEKLSGMTGTALTSAEEFYKVYGLKTIAIPPNKPSGRVDRQDQMFQTENGKYQAIARKVKQLQEKGQPVLIGTISIEKNELLGDFLKREGVKFEMLNAKNHEREGEIIAQAGRLGAVTVATNMAGRGVDIKLGGNPSTTEDYEKVKELGGLFVLGTERHDARRIDNQLRGRSGRQGDPGETEFYVSMEDQLMRVFASDMVKKMMGKLGIPEDVPIENKLVSRSLESAQEKIEGFNFDSRKHVLEYDDVLNFQRKTFYERRRAVLLDESDHRLRHLKLQIFDMFWVEHLETMDYLRSSVGLRAYGQRDPLVEYKKEGLRLFKQMEENIEKATEEALEKLKQDPNAFANPASEVEKQAKQITNTAYPQPLPKGGEEVGRNDPCPCGAINPNTGKIYKYKHCGLIDAPHHIKS